VFQQCIGVLVGVVALYRREEPVETAVRELEEETGYRAASVEHLLTFQPMVGMVDSSRA
jgi:ADP-ribose pyrophosphatase YjhB (NUDIX family)